MSLLALLAATGTPGPVDPPSGEWPNYDPPADTTPYAFPASWPYNAPTVAVTPTADGSGQVVHPSVIDFQTQHGMTNWNGYRYWMGITGFKGESDTYENPHILASHDGYTWAPPPGLTNPIDPKPAGLLFNSDTDIVYDRASARLWCYWRETQNSAPYPERIHVAWSTNGHTWTQVENVISFTSDPGPNTVAMSPAVQMYGPDDWRMVTISTNPAASSAIRTAPSATGPWSSPTPVTFTYLGTKYGTPWHFTQVYVGGTSYGLIYVNSPSTLVTCTSTDGQAWAVSQERPVVVRPGEFDAKLYRSALTPHEDGMSFRLWYPVNNVAIGTENVWNLAYTIVPKSLWPAPPA